MLELFRLRAQINAVVNVKTLITSSFIGVVGGKFVLINCLLQLSVT